MRRNLQVGPERSGGSRSRRRGRAPAADLHEGHPGLHRDHRDRNPPHYDRALAEKTSFGRLIVQGGVPSGILNAVVAEDLPGPGAVFRGVEWKFVEAVGIDEEIVGRVEVTSVRDDKPICTLETTVRNGAGEACLTGTAVTYTVPLEMRR